MYIKKIYDSNVGPINKLAIDFPFDGERPKPIILVGENGTGKSTFLSNIVDSLYEIAGIAFPDARQLSEPIEFQYYKVISPAEIHFGGRYMYSYIVFEDSEFDPSKIEYIFKCGNLSIDRFRRIIEGISQNITWEQQESYKKAVVDKNRVKSILSRDIFCYFGPDRYEKPFWMGNRYYEATHYEQPIVKNQLADRMKNPILINNVTNKTLQWLMDIIVDSRGDIKRYSSSRYQLQHVSVDDLVKLGRARTNIETVMSNILGKKVYFGLNFRSNNGSRFSIKSQEDDSVVVPTLDALSTGQSALFNMFATIVRYSDANNIDNSVLLKNITGIVVIDEIELHLHSTLQRDILPNLIALFPKVQFIISTHSPLFLLGMKEKFGEDGFEIYQMPQAMKIPVERFSEFQNAYTYLIQSQKFENEVQAAISSLKKEKMIVITEGATDWKHMKAAYNDLSQNSENADIFDGLEFEFFEYEPANSETECKKKLEMGNKMLCSLCESYAKIKQNRKMVFVADRDDKSTNSKLQGVESPFKKWGNNVYSFILPVPDNRKDTPDICIEHLYSDDVIKTEVQDKHSQIKRRLYMGNEFDERGISTSLGITCEKKNICGRNSISIIEGSTGERVTSFEDSKTNIALSKMMFAKMILDRRPPFDKLDFTNFLAIFKILKEISEDEYMI